MTDDTDVIIIGAGGGGAVAAYELGKKGIKVLLLEAGPWYGNKKWPNPNQERGAISSTSSEDLSIDVFDTLFTNHEGDMNDIVSGKFRWGPADRKQNAWPRRISQAGFAWQSSGVGGATQCYFTNSPRAYPQSVDNVWPISYTEIIPYYEKVEKTLPIRPAPMYQRRVVFLWCKKSWMVTFKNTQYIKSGVSSTT